MFQNQSDSLDYHILLCREHINIKHTDDDPKVHIYKESAFGNNVQTPCFVWVPPEIRIIDKMADNWHEELSIYYMILTSVNNQDVVARREGVALCDGIASDFISRYRRDYLKDYNSKPWANWDPNSIERTEVKPWTGNNLVGMGVYFKVSYPVMKKLKYDSTKWQ